MTRTLIILFLFCSMTAYSQKTKQSPKSIKTAIKNKPNKTYQFGTLATVNGCSDVLLQKISPDRKYEILVELKMEGIPIQKEIEISQFIKFVKITFNKYPKDNKYIHHICNDVIIINKRAKASIKYTAVSGSLIITRYSDKDFIISCIIKNLKVKNKSGEIINLPLEKFSDLIVNWKGG